MFVYVKPTGEYAFHSDRQIVSEYSLVNSLPPNKDSYLWDFDQEEWVWQNSTAIKKLTGNNAQEEAVATVLDVSTPPTVEDQKLAKVVLLDDLSKLSLSNDFNDWNDTDVFYYKNSTLRIKNEGINITQKGIIAFPQLTWNKETENKTANFVFFVDRDYSNFGFGLASLERFIWQSNDYTNAEVYLSFQGSKGIKYQFGLNSNDYPSQATLTYESIEPGFYRLAIEGNGARGKEAKLYHLIDGSRQNWMGEDLIQTIPLAQVPSHSGVNLVPFVGDRLGSKNYLLGVYLS